MSSKQLNFDVRTEAQFYADVLQLRHLDQVALDAGIHVPSKERINKVLFTTYLLSHNKSLLLKSAYRNHISAKLSSTKQRREERNSQRRTARAAERIRQAKAPDSPRTHATNQREFLEVVPKSRVKQYYRKFYEATSRAKLQHHTCAVCARSRTAIEEKIVEMKLTDLPNSHRLTPSPSQQSIIPASELTHGLVLSRPACRSCDNDIHLRVCEECLRELTKPDIPHPPRFSLANDLWTGSIPWELDVLTLPERLLISLHFTRVYVIKLQPKAGTIGFDSESLQSALVGNVIAYEHNMSRISAMANGDILPHKPEILASLISIALVSVGTLHKSWLRSTFQVRRYVVQRALRWLKAHNPYYKDVVIDDARVNSLPPSDIPEEITACLRRDDDPTAADRERAGYVLYDNDIGHDAGTYTHNYTNV